MELFHKFPIHKSDTNSDKNKKSEHRILMTEDKWTKNKKMDSVWKGGGSHVLEK